MAWANGGLFVQPWMASLKLTTNATFDLDGHTYNVALYNNSPNGPTMFSAALANAVYLAGDWVTGNECSGTNWAAGGQPLTTLALVESPTGTLMWTADPIAVANTTISTGVYGALIYDNQSGLTAKYGLCAMPFSGAPFVTSGGVFSITWPAGGIFAMDLTP